MGAHEKITGSLEITLNCSESLKHLKNVPIRPPNLEK